MNPEPRVGVGVFIWRDGKFLIGQRLGAHGADTWSIPGGKLEYGESWEETAIREVFEETGLTVGNSRLVTITNDIYEADRKHFVSIWVDTDWISGEPIVTEPDKWVDPTWVTFQTLPTPLFEPNWTNLRAAKPELFI